MKPHNNSLALAAAIPLVLVTLASSAFAADASWNWPSYNFSTTWATNANWFPAAFPGATTGTTNADIATFSAFGDQIVTTPTGLNIGGITFASPGAFTNDYYFTGGTLLPSANALIQTDSTFRGIANINTAPTLQGNLTLTANGQPGSVLFLANAITTAADLGAITLTLNGSNTGQHTQSNNLLSGIISNASNTTLKVVKAGAGDWILQGANSYTGGTDLSGGTLIVNNAAALGSTGTINVLADSTIRTATSLNDPSARISIADGVTLTYNTFGASPTWAGILGNSGASNTAALTKAGLGELVILPADGQKQTYKGDTTVNAGMLRLSGVNQAGDYANLIDPASDLVLGGGILYYIGKAGFTSSQTFASTTLNPGVSEIRSGASSGTNTIDFGAITRNPGALLHITTASGFTYKTSNTNNAGGLLKGVILSGNDFARNDGSGNIVTATYTTENDASLWTSDTANYVNNGAVSGTVGTATINSLKLNFAGSNTVSITGTLAVNDGIIFTSTIGNNPSEITGGTLTGPAGGGDLIITSRNQQNNYGRNTVSSVIADNGAPINVILHNTPSINSPNATSLFVSGNNTYTGSTYVGGGVNSTNGTFRTVIGGTAGASIGSPAATVFVNGGSGGASNVLQVGNNDGTGDVKGTIDLVNGRLSLNRNDTFTLSAAVRSANGIGSISQDSTGSATVNLATGGHFFQSLGSSAAGTLNLSGSGSYTFASPAAGFNTSSTTNFNSGTYYFGATGNTTNSVGTWVINGASVTIAGGRYFNSGGGTVTLNSGTFRTNGPALNSGNQSSANIIYNVTGGTFITPMQSNLGTLTSLGLGTGSPTATGSTVFNQSGGEVNVSVPANANISSTSGQGLAIGVTGSTHESSYNLSGGTLRVFAGGIGVLATAGAPGTGGSNNFNWTGGTLTTNGYNGSFLTSSSVTGTLVQNGATTILSPGDTYEGRDYSGRTAITGNYQINSGKLAIGIGGTTAAASFHETPAGRFDNLTVTGTATLGGELIVSLRNGFDPAANSFTVINATGGVSGTFTNVSGDRVPVSGGGSFLVTISGSTVVLSNYLAPAAGDDYDSWATDNSIPGAEFEDDFDNDGLSNGVEYALGRNPTTSSQPPGVLSGNSITFTKGADAIANADVSWIIETSTTLAPGSWTAEVTQPAGDPAATIAYTFTPGSPEKKFARLKVVRVPAP